MFFDVFFCSGWGVVLCWYVDGVYVSVVVGDVGVECYLYWDFCWDWYVLFSGFDVGVGGCGYYFLY